MYYPVLTEDSQKRYEKYLSEAESYGNIVLCGRLAEFRYYNMDICIEHALEKFQSIKGRLTGETDQNNEGEVRQL